MNEAVESENLEAVGTCFEKGSRDTQEPLLAALPAG
jgi:hypothetical protein